MNDDSFEPFLLTNVLYLIGYSSKDWEFTLLREREREAGNHPIIHFCGILKVEASKTSLTKALKPK